MNTNTVLTGIFTTRSPLSHIGESISTGTLLNERKIIQDSGHLIDVFCYNANALRGQLRDLAALYLVKELQIEELSTENHNFLFSGGKIGGASKFNVKKIRDHQDLLPIFSVFGGCLDNMMLPGKLIPFDLLPLCQEAITELPQNIHSKAVEKTYRSMTIDREFTRMDDAKNMKLNQTISASAMDDKEQIQMRMGGELLNSGIDLFSRLIITDATDKEKGMMCSALMMFSETPYIGGQHNKGHGRVDLQYDLDGDHFFSTKDYDVKTSDKFDSFLNEYNKHIVDKSDEIRALLS